MVQQFNLENATEKIASSGEDEAITEDEYGIKSYEKSKTQFDGVTSEMQVSYLQLGREHGVEIPVLSTGTRNVNTDFTVMLWFKIDASYGKDHEESMAASQPSAVSEEPVEEEEVHQGVQIMYLFSFEDSAACFFTDSLTLMCDSWDRRKLQVSASEITPGIWYHLTLSSSADGESFLMIQTHHGVVSVDSTANFGFRQNTVYGWKACLGDCTSNYGIVGAIREVVMFDLSVTQEQARRAKNLILTYNSSIKSYFRFQDQNNKFQKDEFVDWPWLKFKNIPKKSSSYIGTDIIPNDVCPSIFDQVSALRFNAGEARNDVGAAATRIDTLDLSEQLKQTKYAYTMSVTLQVNETACVATTPNEAQKDCNLVELEGVFMLYMMGRNTARFHFFASKNYYESASKLIYLPYDQWITIQLSIDHFDGYVIVVADQNGNAFYRTRVQQNMQEQWPSNELNILRAFDGFVEHFYLTDQFKTLNPYYATDFRNDADGLINVDFLATSFEEGKFVNRGRMGSGFSLSGGKDAANFQDVFFKVPSEGGDVAGTLDDESTVFDGIACNDRHMTTHFNEDDSFIQFLTPQLQDWSKANTIEFWFKLHDVELYEQSVSLFSMVSNENNNPTPYYHVYIEEGQLKCAPFGTKSFKDPIIVFTDFTKENEDIYGWWHVSCSYAFQQTAKGTLFNTQTFQMLEETMVGLPKFYPTNQLMATFGKNTRDDNSELQKTMTAAGVLVKEFRFWNRQQQMGELSNNRYRQIDPSKLANDELLVYLRLATGSSLIWNFASESKSTKSYDLGLKTSGLSFLEDFIETERYSYDSKLDLVVEQKLRTYHTVCPVHTYYMNQYCYNEPVNKVVLGIFPQWNEEVGRVDWKFNLHFSSVINREVVQFLTESFNSNDKILNSYLGKDFNEQKLEYTIPSTVLRHESEYTLAASLSNDERTFFREQTVKFVPSKCKWFEVVGGGVTDAYTIYDESPGTADVSFQLQLKRNVLLDCTQFDFFDTFVGLDFDFTMTDTAEYISYIPQMEIVAYDPITLALVALGDKTPNGMLVNVTMPMTEQIRLPVFQDIMVMMSVHWTSSKSWDLALTKDLIFQNVLYMMKFEPVANVLFADLVASQTDVIREETLILDASSSYISNMPMIAQRRSLAYDWTCPEKFVAFCDKSAGDQLAIPFNIVKEIDADFEKPLTFKVTVIWAKADGRTDRQSVEATVTWYDLAMPKFSIDYDTAQTLITSDQNTLFYLEAQNFAIDDIYEYEVEWQLEPELEDPNTRSVLSGGRVMQVLKGSYAKNTDYKVTLTVTSKQLKKLKNVQSVAFATLAPPVGGSVQVNPLQGYIGDKFTVILQDWTSANLPIEYNVYTTFDQAGSRKGMLLNEDGPIPVNEDFAFVAQRTTPLIVAVFDASGETLEYLLNPQIRAKPAADDKDTANKDKKSSATDATGDSSLPSPQSLLVQISEESSLRQRVNYMGVAIETVQRLDPEGSDGASQQEQQINFRKQLVDELHKQVTEFDGRDKTDALYMTPNEFLIESFKVIAELTSEPKYLDQDVVDKCTQVIYRLTELDDGLFYLVLEADLQGPARQNYFTSLENINKFARINDVEWTLQWVRHQLKITLDNMCTWVDLPEVFEYNSYQQELGFSLFRFDQSTALKAKRGTLHALDASYDYNAYTAYGWFAASQPGQLCMQVVGQQWGTVLMRGAYIGNSKARLSVAVYEPGTGTTHTMGELSGSTIATFDLDQSTFHSNQTMCMGYAELENLWKSDLCQWELDDEKVQMKCSCNAFGSELIGIFTDFTRILGAPVAFPPPIERVIPTELKDGTYVVVPTDAKVTESETTTSSTDESATAAVGTNYVWMGQTLMFSILTICGCFVTRKQDQKDDQTQGVARTAPIPVAKQNHFMNEVANELNEPYAAVYYRKQAVMYYRTIFSKSAFPHLMSQLHPLISPFTSFYATQSRTIRFAIYMLQFNIISTFVFLYYASVYRVDDLDRKADVVESDDISSVIVSILLCSILLTPWLSEPLIKTCANQLVASSCPNSANITQPVVIKTRRSGLRITILILTALSTIALPLWAIIGSNSVAASSQYCMATTMIGSTFLATLGTNLIYLWINACLARKVAYSATGGRGKKQTISGCLVHFRALQIVRDMKAVVEIKDQFTLGDVLPSSIDCSDRSLCSHHSAGNMSRQHQSQSLNNMSKQLPAIHEKTINAEECLSEELYNENEQRATLELIRSPSEEAKERIQTDHQAEHSQRALKFPQEVMAAAGDESSKHNLIASMLANSMIDLDVSRNDVVPQRTQLDSIDDIPRGQQQLERIRVHPEGMKYGNGVVNEPGSSLEQISSNSDSIQSDQNYRQKIHRGPKNSDGQLHRNRVAANGADSSSLSEREDNEAEQTHKGKPERIVSAVSNAAMCMTVKPKVILQ